MKKPRILTPTMLSDKVNICFWLKIDNVEKCPGGPGLLRVSRLRGPHVRDG